MEPMNNKLIIFDLDGTLIDSAKTVSNILNVMRLELGLQEVPNETFLPWISLGGDTLVSNALEVHKNDVAPYTKTFWEKYYDLQTPDDSVYPGVVQTLEFLLSCGVRLNLCTNKPRKLAEKVLNETKLEKFFSFICAGGDLKTNKPNPANLLACINSNRKEILDPFFVGDSTVDEETAANAKVKFIFFENGYDDGVDKQKTYSSFNDYRNFGEILFK
jgi:phosphoglycolate phosphatase